MKKHSETAPLPAGNRRILIYLPTKTWCVVNAAPDLKHFWCSEVKIASGGNPPAVAGAAALLRPLIEVAGDEGARLLTARLADGSTRPLADFVTDWAAGEGAAYLAAPDSHGGGARPEAGAGRHRRRADLGGPAERARFIREHGRAAYLDLDP